MTQPSGEVDIARNIRAIEWLRTELIGIVGVLCRAMLKGSSELMLDALSGLIMTTYLLGRRLGFTFSRIDARLSEKLGEYAREPHELEQAYGDFSALRTYIEDKSKGESVANLRG